MDLHDFEIVAANYDRYVPSMVSEEHRARFVDFHLQLANEYGRNGILDLACGTGNIALPLAQAGYTVYAFDVSEAMIRRLRVKTEAMDDAMRARMDISVQDMVDFSFDRRFSLAMIPRSGFMHLTTPEDQRKALLNIHRHLENGGILSFNTFDPNLALIAANLGSASDSRKRTEFQSANHHRMEIHESTSYDPESQQIRSVWLFREYDDNNEIVDETEVPLRMRYSFRQETKYLLELTGFAVQHLYGSYDKRDAHYPSDLIWVARKQ